MESIHYIFLPDILFLGKQLAKHNESGCVQISYSWSRYGTLATLPSAPMLNFPLKTFFTAWKQRRQGQVFFNCDYIRHIPIYIQHFFLFILFSGSILVNSQLPQQRVSHHQQQQQQQMGHCTFLTAVPGAPCQLSTHLQTSENVTSHNSKSYIQQTQ